MAELKRLEFVKGYATQGAGTADWVYQTARGFVPGFVEPYVKQVEETTLNVAAPYLTLAQDSAEKVLVAVDGQVDSTLTTLSGAVDYAHGVHEKNMKTFNSAKNQYYSFVETSVNHVKQLLDPTPYVQWASHQVEYYADPDKIVDTGAQYADKVASFGPVPKVVEIADPLIKTSLKTYGSVHDTVVSLPLYKRAWDLIWSTSAVVQDSWPAHKLYTVAEPFAEPLYSNFSNSKYLAQLASHFRPVHTA